MIQNRVIIVVSTTDQAGMNMLERLLQLYNFPGIIPEIPDTWPSGEYLLYQGQKISILKIPEPQILVDYFVDGIDAELLIFASKHSSAAGQKALLVHTTGIWQKETGHGGRDHELGIAPANLLSYAYEKIKEYQEERGLDYWTGIECTHHGPSSLEIPVAYFEAGGTETEWNDRKATRLIADVIQDTIEAYLNGMIADNPAFIGIGGNHYCSRFIKILDEKHYGLGHVLPKYAIHELPAEMLTQAYDKTVASEKIFLIDRKGVRADDRDRFIEYIEKNGYTWEYA